VLVLWRQDNVLFTHADYIDPWFYVGYAKDLVEFKRALFPGHYSGSRLAWILPCYAVHSLFSPVPAACILHLGVWAVGVFSFFFTLRWIVGGRAAFLSAVLLGTHSWFWYSTGWDYPDGAALGCVLLTTALYTYAALRPVRPIPLVLAGVAAAAALHCTLGWAGLAPLFPLTYIGLVHAWHKRPVRRALLEAVLWSGLGGVLLTAALGAVNYRLDGNFWFFMPSFQQGQHLASKPIRWLSGVWDENGLSPYLWFGVAAVLVSLVLLPGRLRKDNRDAALPALVFSAQCLLTLAFLCYFQRSEAHGLSYIYYACYLMPFTFLVIGTSFWKGIDGLSTRTWLSICGLAVAVPGLLWCDYAGLYLHGCPAAGVVACLAGLLLLAALRVRRAAVACLLAIGGFAVLTVQSRWLQEPDPHVVRRGYEHIMQARSRLEQLRRGRPVHFWLDDQDPEYYSYLGLTASYISADNYLQGRFPQLTCGPTALKGKLLVALSSRPGAPELARRALTDCLVDTGLVVQAESPDSVQGNRARYTVTMVSAVPAPDTSVWEPLKSVFDDTGAEILTPSSGPADHPALPLNGWRNLSQETIVNLSSEGLAVRTLADPDGIAIVFPQLAAPMTGRYRFVFRYKLHSGNLVLGLRKPGAGGWIASEMAATSYPPVEETTVTADLKRGDVFQLQIANHNGLDSGATSFVLREVIVLRSDLQRQAPVGK
jgi:hypothetical protein